VEPSQLCPKCGRVIPEGQNTCRCTVRPRRYWLHSRETILLLSVIGLVIAFAITGFAARLYHGRRAELARSWFDRGNVELQTGHPAAAASDLRSALIYAEHELPPEQQGAYELDLAQALLANGNSDEARSYLLDLWERMPGNSRVNLELARLAADMGDDADAKRYYNGAIYGVWDESEEDVLRSRMDTRLEFYRYLTSHGETTEAQAVLLATAAGIPPDPGLHVQVGQLMLQSAQTQQALDQFLMALKLDPRNYDALAGAGLTYFQQGNDRDAVRYLESAARQNAQQKRRPGQQSESEARESQESRVAQDLAIAQSTLALDPNRPGLSAMDRADRAIRAYDAAEMRIRACASEHATVLPQPSRNLTRFTHAASDDLAVAALANHLEQLEPLMQFVFEMESAATENCGPPSDPTNAAIERIGARTQASIHE
jgi:tetratricopeptide (TPR) repeat protein